MTDILLIEDSAVFVMGLKLALSAYPSFGNVESVASAGAAVSFLNAHPETDIAVVDITLESETDGLTLLGILHEAFPGVKTLVLSHYKNPAYILRAVSSGASAYLAKDSAPGSIIAAIADVAAASSPTRRNRRRYPRRRSRTFSAFVCSVTAAPPSAPARPSSRPRPTRLYRWSWPGSSRRLRAGRSGQRCPPVRRSPRHSPAAG